VRSGPVGRREEALAGEPRPYAERLVLRDEAGEVFGVIGAANQWCLTPLILYNDPFSDPFRYKKGRPPENFPAASESGLGVW